jgi:hypothetical protein
LPVTHVARSASTCSRRICPKAARRSVARSSGGRSAEFGERIEQFGWHLARDQRSNEGGLFEFIDRVFDLIDQAPDVRAGIEARDLAARLQRNAIGLFLDALGATGER